MTLDQELADEAQQPSACASFTVHRVRDGVLQEPGTDHLAEELAIALEYNGISYATMLATPADLEDFAYGFSLTEGIVDAPTDIRGVDVVAQSAGIVVQVEISAAREAGLKARRRALAGRTGCGLCGVETLAEVARPVTPLVNQPGVSLTATRLAQAAMRARQQLHDLTGATHAAALADVAGRVRCVREDVGRHNALDKLIGAVARRQSQPGDIIVVSSRASFEMVQKTLAAGVGALCAVSAPTGLAVRMAERNGLVLIGFQRGATATVYAGAQRVVE